MTSKAEHQTARAIEARRRHTEALLQRVRDAIAQLRKEHIRVTVRAVERRADVSRTFLYQNQPARCLVTEAIAQAQGVRAQDRQTALNAVEASWRERALNAEDGLKRATAEIRAQRRGIAELLGRIRDLELDLPADAVQHLTTENTTLKHQVRTLTDDNKKLTERLSASRDNNRSQDKKIADLQGQLLEHYPQHNGRHLSPLQG